MQTSPRDSAESSSVHGNGCMRFRGSLLLCVVEEESATGEVATSTSTAFSDEAPTETVDQPSSDDGAGSSTIPTPSYSEVRSIPLDDALSRLLDLVENHASITSSASHSPSTSSASPAGILTTTHSPSSSSLLPGHPLATHSSSFIPEPSHLSTPPPIIKDDNSTQFTLIGDANPALLFWGVLLGCTAVIFLLLTCLMCLLCRRKRKGRSTDEESRAREEEEHTVEYTIMFGDGASPEEVTKCLASFLDPTFDSAPLKFPSSQAGSNVKLWMRREGRKRKTLPKRSSEDSS